MLTLAYDSTAANPRRGWATVTSFAMQGAAVGIALLIPLLQPGLLARLDLTPHLVPIFVPRAATANVQHRNSGRTDVVQPLVLTEPHAIPRGIDRTADAKAGDADAACLQCVEGIGQNEILGGMGVIPLASAPLLPKLAAKPPRISVMMDGYLMHRVQPEYPAMARQARIHGLVELAAVIGKQGAIENLQALSGHPMLIPAALNAVKQWRYRPYVLNGDPIEVNTRITVTFTLGN